MKKIFATILFAAFSFNSLQALAHGSLELIECHNKDNSIVLRGEAMNKKNDFAFVLLKNSKKVWSEKGIRLELKDTVEESTLYENITIQPKTAEIVKIKVAEVGIREIRNGSGKINFKKQKAKADLSCYAVY